MRIIASRRDDIIKRRDEYDAKAARNKAIRDEQYDRFSKAQKDVFSSVENEIRRQLGDKIGELYIRVDTRFGSGIQVQIGNDRGGPRREAHASLTWSWSAFVDENGNVKKESSSWSGLEATTMDQIQDLKICVEQLEIINTMDWGKLLDVSLPSWRDYIDDSQMEKLDPRPDFDRELLEADLEDAIGNNVLIKAQGGGKAFNGEVYFQILRDSGSQYTVRELPGRYVDMIQKGEAIPYRGTEVTSIAELVDVFDGYTSRVRKANFFGMIYKPLQMVQF